MIPFYKMNGAGNKIIVADMRGREDEVAPDAAVKLAGGEKTSFDQLMEVRDPQQPGDDASMRIFNSDGSMAQACGNGTRCVVAMLSSQDGRKAYKLRSVAGLLETRILDNGLISVDMGIPRFRWDQIPLEEEFGDTTGIELQVGPIDNPVLHTPSVANMGNPHAVFWVDRDVWDFELDRFGPLLENHPVFPERANINIAQVVAPDRIIMRTWERGAGLTLACGSGACATLVSAVRKGLSARKAVLVVPGGELLIEWRDDNRVFMSGPAEFEFSGQMDPASGAFELG